MLLRVSLVITPAATARRLAPNLTNMLTISVLVALASTLLGDRWPHADNGKAGT